MTCVRTSFKVFAFILAFAALPALASSTTSPAPAYTDNGFQQGLLNASRPRAERMKLFAHMIALANQGQVPAQDLAGTLYWRGARIHGSPVKTNLVQARKLLANAAIHGDTLAMAKLGELELAAGRLPQAMVWAQLYARYVNPMALQRGHHGGDTAYASDLIGRILKAGGKIDAATKTRVASMVNRFDKSIRRGIDAYQNKKRSGRVFLIHGPAGAPPRDIDNLNGVAEYLIGFDPDGKPVNIMVLDAFPHPELATLLREPINHVMANPNHDVTGTRYLRVPLTHNAVKYRQLRATH